MTVNAWSGSSLSGPVHPAVVAPFDWQDAVLNRPSYYHAEPDWFMQGAALSLPPFSVSPSPCRVGPDGTVTLLYDLMEEGRPYPLKIGPVWLIGVRRRGARAASLYAVPE